jgi:hypothetical protein
MYLGAAVTAMLVASAVPAVSVVEAPASPVRLDHLKVLNGGDSPLVLLYAATNVTDAPLDQFTVTVFVFDKDGQLKARQVAPGRRTLNAHETKYSTMVLDVGAIDAADSLLAGVDQAQRVNSDEWWRADIRTLAEQQVKGGGVKR